MSTQPYPTAIEAAKALRSKEISSYELTETVIARIDQANPRVNAIATTRPEEALREAALADEARDPTGPLHGVPITVKESFHLTGSPVTWGNPTFAGYLSDWDATVVQRLRRAGAIVVGQSNPHFMLSDFGQTTNEVYGRTNNPWDLDRTPGGSSGGAAAALAAGMTFLDYGTDLAGSIRIPAAFCGVYGLRPSAAAVPLTGMQPPGPPPPPGLDEMSYISAVGPLARSAGDLRLALTLTAGPEDPEAKAYQWNLPAPRHTRLKDFRVGVVLDHPAAPVHGDVAGVLSNAVDTLAAKGVRVVEGWPQGVDPVAGAEAFGFHVGLFLAYQTHQESPAAGRFDHEHRRVAFRAAWHGYFRDIDVWLCPVNFTAAFPHDDPPPDYDAQGFWIANPALPGLPCLSVPIGLTEGGLPVGLQVVGPRFEDDTAITFAELLAREIDGAPTAGTPPSGV